MSLDVYTKGVLTVIAAALCALVIQNAIRESKAQGALQKVEICDDHDCLGLTTIRKRASTGDRFLTLALPIFVETDSSP
jgi:hypothetical protein